MQVVINWIANNYFELTAAVLGLVSIFLQIRQRASYWLVSIVMVSMYIVVYIRAKLYADMSLQFYYLVVSFYGWYQWLFGKNNGQDKSGLKVTDTSAQQLAWLGGIALVLFWVIAIILKNFTDSDVPFWDAFTTALSFVATWMLARKKIENWLIWIVVDAVSVGIYIYKGLFPTVVLFTVLTLLAFVGYKEWKKDLNANEN